ncbi:thioredoxin family protein [Luteibacter sp. 329MFSha]|uniref:thioredoxin family protein n=1 Tax=Luteibacter sp. 329MFSha TaxID=1798239 RepID=UPI0008C8183E|nr:thioredoxin family protein [Luteibacter sp. 329MFSha]SEW12020.1 Thioredoxin [Luteibacter sp. 329MFSha]
MSDVTSIDDGTATEWLSPRDITLAVVMFWATFSDPCRPYAVVFKGVAAGNADVRLRFASVDVDAALNTVREQDIRQVPTTHFFRNGQLIDRAVGYLSTEALKAKIEALLNA